MDVDVLRLHAGGLGGEGQREVGVLGADPDVDAVRLHMGDGVEGLHRRMGDDRHLVGRLDHLGGAWHRGIDIAVVARFDALLVEGLEILLAELGAVGRAGGADVPFDLERIERVLRAVVTVRHHRDRVLEPDHLKDAAAPGDLALVDGFHRAAEHRAFDDGRPHHVRHFEIDTVLRGAVDLERHVEPREAPADELVLVRPLERRLLVELDRGGVCRELAEAERAAGRLVRHLAQGRGAFGGRHVPALGGGCDQPLARAGTGLLDDHAGLAHGAAAAGGEAAIDLVVDDVAVRRSVFGLDEGPVAFELLGENLGQRSEAALAHLGAAVADDDGVVGLDHHPGIDLAGIAFALLAPGADAQARSLGGLAKADTERKAAGRGEGGGDEVATRESEIVHGALPFQARISAAARCTARRRRS